MPLSLGQRPLSVHIITSTLLITTNLLLGVLILPPRLITLIQHKMDAGWRRTSCPVSEQKSGRAVTGSTMNRGGGGGTLEDAPIQSLSVWQRGELKLTEETDGVVCFCGARTEHQSCLCLASAFLMSFRPSSFEKIYCNKVVVTKLLKLALNSLCVPGRP